MSGPEFYSTGMGRRFFEGTMPDLVRELRKLNQNIADMREVGLFGSKVPQADRQALGLEPTGMDSAAFRKLLTALIVEAENSGESAGRLLGEHFDDPQYEDRELFIAELENIEEWVTLMKNRARTGK